MQKLIFDIYWQHPISVPLNKFPRYQHFPQKIGEWKTDIQHKRQVETIVPSPVFYENPQLAIHKKLHLGECGYAAHVWHFLQHCHTCTLLTFGSTLHILTITFINLMMDSRIANQWRHKCNSNMYSSKLNTGGKGWSFTVVRFWLATSIHSLVTTKILEVYLQISCRQTQLQCPSIDFDFCTKVLFTQKLNRSSSTLDIQKLQNSSKILFCRITTVSWRIPD